METVFVGLSGGVDSSVAALRLKNQGYNVVGVFIKVWQPDFLECNWEAERLDAMRVAAHLEIPFLTCDAEETYRTEVGEFFINEYKKGRTPNPDVLCNQQVKFGAFLRFALGKGADFVATGHYAQRVVTEAGIELHRGVDTNKDQSYFLWTLTQAQLQHILLPVGNSPKEQIRKEAAAAGIPVAAKKDSQGVCFLGHIDIPEFLAHFITLETGAVLNTAGEHIGEHKGALVYTIGQRQGFDVTKKDGAQKALYVVDRDILENTITVRAEPPILKKENFVTLQDIHWITEESQKNFEIEAQFRYRQTPFAVRLLPNGTLELKVTTEAVAAGQSCVLYRGSLCLGGGIIA